MKVLKILLIFFLAAIAIGSCKKDAPAVYDVDPAFEDYVQRFITEGAARGVDINFDDTGLLVEFSDQIVNNASGFCYVDQYHVVIDKAEWNALTDDQKDFLMFHELGHCVLDRRHRNDQFGDDTWVSMMRGDPLAGNQERIPVAYHGFRIPYYLDELFVQSSPTPSWANVSFNINDVTESDKTTFAEKFETPRLIESISGISNDFEIDVDIKGINTVPWITEMVWGSSSDSYFIRIYKNFGTFIGVVQNGLDQEIFFHPTQSDLDNITIRQQNGITSIFFDEEFLFHFDALPSALTRITLEGRDGNDVLASNFEVEVYRLSELD